MDFGPLRIDINAIYMAECGKSTKLGLMIYFQPYTWTRHSHKLNAINALYMAECGKSTNLLIE